MNVSEADQAEIDKYQMVYERSGHNYGLKAHRERHYTHLLSTLDHRGSYLDVGCGHGDMLRIAKSLGFGPCRGTEVVDSLTRPANVDHAVAWEMPYEDNSFELVTLFDVIEHILPSKAAATCLELERVAAGTVIVAPANHSSVWYGQELHVNRRPFQEWDAFFREVFSGAVKRIDPPAQNLNPVWSIRL